MKKVIGLLVATLATLGSVNVKANENSFYQHWVHSGEEQNGQKPFSTDGSICR